MTEAQKTLKEHFLEPETRCGFYVDADRKSLWASQIEMLQMVLDICKKRHLKVWMAGGSLLGAIRHKGYIPWDDDIDLMMPRKDFDCFCRVAQQDLSSGYFLQTQYTDPSFHLPIAKVRKNATAAIVPIEAAMGLPFHQGLFIDIFPLDFFPVDQKVISTTFRRMAVLHRARHTAHLPNHRFLSQHHTFLGCLRRLACLFLRIRILNYFLTKTEDALSKGYLEHNDLPYMLGLGFWNLTSGGNCDNHKFVYPQDLFTKTLLVPYEFIEVPVPARSERILEITYGDWRSFVRGGSFHKELDISFDKDWRDLLVEKYGYKKGDFKYRMY